MIKLLLTGLWVCILTAGGSYAVAYWKENGSLLDQKEEYLDGLQYQKTRALSVPMVENGSVQGYIVARFVYTVEARTMQQLTVPPDPFVVDEAFRRIYADERLDFMKLARYDLSVLTAAIKQH